jgi:hypothetical protein
MIKLINLKQPILTLKQKPILDIGNEEKVLTIGSAFVSALEMHQKPGEGIKAYEIGGRFIKATEENEIELSEDDVKFLKKVISESSTFVSVVVGRLTDYLNKNNTEVEKVEENTNVK